MKNYIYSVAGLFILAAVIIGSCGRAPSTHPTPAPKYDIRGSLLKNLEKDSVAVSAGLKKDDIVYSTAIMIFTGDTLDYAAGTEVYSIAFDTVTNFPSGSYYLKVKDLPDLNDSVAVIIPDDVSITSLSVTNNDNPYGDSIQITWTASPNCDGYVVGTVLKNSAYQTTGYSTFIDTAVGTTAYIPRAAFRPAGEIVLGWYYIYVFSYTGSPAGPLNLPFGFPTGLADTISNSNFSGTFGGVTISMPESVLVHDTLSSHNYDLRGAIVKNLDTDSTLAAVTLKRDNFLYSLADVKIYDTPLGYDDITGNFVLGYSGASMPAAGEDTLAVTDTPFLDRKYSFILPDDLLLTSISLPDNRINAGGAPVQIQWSASLQNDGYIFAVVLKDSTYLDDGYAEFVDEGVTSATIPPDAFRLHGDTLAIGWYYVYVYSYTGSPGSTYNLPTSIPAGLSDNISQVNITGQFGTIVVSPRDSIYVDASK
jgi:hypothetical protein